MIWNKKSISPFSADPKLCKKFTFVFCYFYFFLIISFVVTLSFFLSEKEFFFRKFDCICSHPRMYYTILFYFFFLLGCAPGVGYTHSKTWYKEARFWSTFSLRGNHDKP